MADMQKGVMYTVSGFGEHVEFKTVEFVPRLDDVHVCSWCGVVSAGAKVLSCWHIVCEDCHEDVFNDANPLCLIDKQNLRPDFSGFSRDLKQALSKWKVRCVYADGGCDFGGTLDALNRHLEDSCAFYLTTCYKCQDSIAHKSMKSHIRTCKGPAGVLLGAADAQSLQDDLRNARKELEETLNGADADDRGTLEDTVELLKEQLERLRTYLAAGAESSVNTSSVDSANKG